MNVTVTQPMDDGDADISPTILRSAIDGFSDRVNRPVELGVVRGDGGVFFNGGTLNTTAVPEPTAFLFGAIAFVAWASCGKFRILW